MSEERTLAEKWLFASSLATTVSGLLLRLQTEKELKNTILNLAPSLDGRDGHELAYFAQQHLAHYGIVPALSVMGEKPTSALLNHFLKGKNDKFSEWVLKHPKEKTAVLAWMLVCLFEPLQSLLKFGHNQPEDLVGNTVGLVAYLALPKMIDSLRDMYNGKKSLQQASDDMARLAGELKPELNLGGDSLGFTRMRKNLS